VLAGDGARARGKLDEAMKHYEKALAYVPEYPGAVVGSKLVGDVFSARRVKSQDSYLKGMRAQASGQYDQTQYHMQIAIENDPSMASARERSDLARRQLADSRLRRARDAEERGWFETALREYKAVLAEFPSLAPDLDSRVAATQREVEAGAMLSDGILLIQRRDFTKARTKLEQAYEKSVAQRAAISAQLIALRETDLDRRYNIAFDLELDYRYDDALAAYRAVDKEWPGQLDVRTRIANLESSLELAKEAKVRGDAAETAGDLPGAIAAFREALTYAPKFGDLEKRIQALRARLDPPKDPAKSDPSPARQPTQ
jgi:tetratricopeptide (TPR) repeat protein